MKLVRIQIDMQYQVPDNVAEHFHNMDSEFFESLKTSFYAWANKPSEVRIPVIFDYRSAIGEVEPAEESSKKE